MKREYPPNLPFLKLLDDKFKEEELKGNRVEEVRISYMDYPQVRLCFSDWYKGGFVERNVPKITNAKDRDFIFGTIWGSKIRIGSGFPRSKLKLKV